MSNEKLFYKSCVNNNLNQIKSLIKKINIIYTYNDQYGYNAFLHCCVNNYIDIINFLLNYYLDIDDQIYMVLFF